MDLDTSNLTDDMDTSQISTLTNSNVNSFNQHIAIYENKCCCCRKFLNSETQTSIYPSRPTPAPILKNG